ARYESEPALCHEFVRHGAGPIARSHQADADGELVLEFIIERMMYCALTLGLPGKQVLEDRHEFLDGTHTGVAIAAMGCLAGNGNAKNQRSTTGDVHQPIGGLCD